jgi:hypothetical protein
VSWESLRPLNESTWVRRWRVHSKPKDLAYDSAPTNRGIPLTNG